jgi:hypothetical protein
MNSNRIHLNGSANELNTDAGVSGSAKPESGRSQPRRRAATGADSFGSRSEEFSP